MQSKIYNLIKKLFPINRSLTGKGNRFTLKILKNINPKLLIKKVSSDTKIYDWRIPLEWEIKNGYILTPNNKKICDFNKNNLSVVGYSISVNKKLNLEDLKKKIYTIPDRPNSIPYITSYYKKDWGFCMTHNQKKKLIKGDYKIFIESSFKKGFLNYGEIFLKGKLKKEIFFSTNICHPSMANNELSGPSFLIYLSKYIENLRNRKYSYRFIFIPETIGSLAYIKKNISKMKSNIFAGFNVVCVGDDRAYSFLPSKMGNTVSDNLAKQALKELKLKYKEYNWKNRGSDERQYCAPGIDLPVTTVIRSKYNEYKEYHTSDDKLGKVVTKKGLLNTFKLYKKIINNIESNQYPISKNLGEPMLSKRNLYPSISNKTNNNNLRILVQILTWSDGKHSLYDISKKLNVPLSKIMLQVKILNKQKLIKFR